MDNIKIIVENGNISELEKKEIFDTFLKRIDNIKSGAFSVQIVINPTLTNKEVELLNGNAKRYLIDKDNIIDDETRIRLAT